MKRPELFVLAISLGITLTVSSLFGFVGSSLFGTFWAWFWICFLVQTILFVTVNSFLIQKDRITSERLSVEALEQFSKFTIKLQCSYCQQINSTPIALNKKNTFKCESCNQTNSISMQFTATPLTTPIESVTIPVEKNETIEFKVS